MHPPDHRYLGIQRCSERADVRQTMKVNDVRNKLIDDVAHGLRGFFSQSLMAGGKTVMTLPRVAVIRSFVMNHTIHHRAQLGVYLRLNDIPVPAVYGPTADEQ